MCRFILTTIVSSYKIANIKSDKGLKHLDSHAACLFRNMYIGKVWFIINTNMSPEKNKDIRKPFMLLKLMIFIN